MTHKTTDTLRRTLAAVFIALILGTAWTATTEQPDPTECLILCEA